MANLPKADELIGSTVTQQQFRTKLKQLVENIDRSYSTLAEANADIANISVGVKVEVLNTVDGGLWEKKTVGATSLTKIDYDPLSQAKNYADTNALFKPRRLTLNENIDSLQDGIYIIPSAAVSSSLVGLPANMKTPKIGYLFSYVAGGGVAFQHIVHYAETTVEEWKRVGNGSAAAFAWKGWQKELELADIAGYQGFLWGRPSSINFDNVNLKLIIGSETRAVYDNTSALLPPQEITYPAGGTYNIVLNKTTKLLSFKATSAGVVNGEVIVGSWFSTGYVVGGIDAYTVNGANGDKRVFTGEIVGDAVDINFDLVNNQLIIPANLVRALVGNNTTFALAQTVPLPVDNYWYRIVFDPTSRLISFSRTSVVLTGEQVQVGEFDSRNRKIYGIISYSINGNPATAGSSDLLTSELIVINGNTDAGYIQETELSGYASFLSTAIHSDVYALYDNLVAQYPEYVSRSLLGNDTTGKPVYCYDFKAPDVVAETHSGYLPKMILVSGVHGFEKSGIMNLFNTLKAICEQWEQNERLETLRWNCHFIVVPLVVPSGFDSNIRHNANGVDIARNFPSDWEQGIVGDITYGGTSPLSEVESQYIDNLLSSNTDAIYFMSHHNFGSSDPARFVWNASATRFGVRLGKMLINRVTHSLKNRYAWVDQYPNYIGISNINAPNGSEGKQATKAYGVQGGTFEIGNNLQFAPDTSQYSSLVAIIGVEILVNWLLLNLEYGSQLYNSKINL